MKELEKMQGLKCPCKSCLTDQLSVENIFKLKNKKVKGIGNVLLQENYQKRILD